MRTTIVFLCLSLAAATAFAGTPDAGDFQINAYTPGDQMFPAVAVDADPAQALFHDGFESGDTGGWSGAQP